MLNTIKKIAVSFGTLALLTSPFAAAESIADRMSEEMSYTNVEEIVKNLEAMESTAAGSTTDTYQTDSKQKKAKMPYDEQNKKKYAIDYKQEIFGSN